MNSSNEIKHQAGRAVEIGIHEAKKSGQDWLDYVEKHPVQSMVFGAVILFAIKAYLNNRVYYIGNWLHH